MAAPVERVAVWWTTAVVATFVLVPLVVIRVPWSEPGQAADFNQRITLQPFDLALLIAAGLSVLLWRLPAPPLPRWFRACLLALAAWYVVALAANPSPRGFELAARVAAVVAVVGGLRRVGPRQHGLVLDAVLVLAAVQAVLGIAQSLHEGPLGLGPLEFEGPLYEFGDRYAGRGGLDHPYHHAFLLLVGLGAGVVRSRGVPTWWRTACCAVAGAGLAVTFGRAVVIALVLAVAVVALRRRSATAGEVRALGAGLVGFAAVALVVAGGWTARVEATRDLEEGIDSGRRQRAEDALELIGDAPVVGVGPGRYVVELIDRVDPPRLGRVPPHNLVLHAGAEAGVPAGALAGAALAGLFVLAWRRRDLAVVPLALALPMLLLDAYPYSFPTGFVLLSLPLGLALRPEPEPG